MISHSSLLLSRERRIKLSRWVEKALLCEICTLGAYIHKVSWAWTEGSRLYDKKPSLKKV